MIDLNHLEKYTENNRIEAKKALGGLPRSIWETYSAFANTLGGIILLGVEEYKDKTLHTVDLPNPEGLVKEFWETINNPSKASVNLLSSKQVRIETVNGDHIIVIEVPRAHRCDQPVFVDNNPKSGTYRRDGEGDHHCTAEELQAMYRDASIYTQDMTVLENMDNSVFCMESVQRYRQCMERSHPHHIWENLDNPSFLLQLGAICIGADDQTHPTAAGLLMFGYEQEILREYPDYFLDYHEEPSDASQSAEHFVSSSGDWSGNVFDFFTHVSSKLAHSLDTQLKAQDTPIHKGVCEALANCLINADYYERAGLVIVKKNDQITMSNPGDFRIELDAARSGGMSDPRNSILMKMFSLINVSEQTGSGIPNILYIWKQQGWSKPTILQAFAPNRVTLFLPLTNKSELSDEPECSAASTQMNASAIQGMIIAYLTDHAKASCAELADLLDLNPVRVSMVLQKMIAAGIIAAQGEPSNYAYKLKA